MTTDTLLIVLGPMIPLLTYVFLWNLVQLQRDVAADRESEAADRVDGWRRDWDFWSRCVESDNPNTRRLAIEMQGFLLASRPTIEGDAWARSWSSSARCAGTGSLRTAPRSPATGSTTNAARGA
jgi:hypothetical protein